MDIEESLQPSCAEVCCAHDVPKSHSQNILYFQVKDRTEFGNTQARSNRELSEHTDSETEDS